MKNYVTNSGIGDIQGDSLVFVVINFENWYISENIFKSTNKCSRQVLDLFVDSMEYMILSGNITHIKPLTKHQFMDLVNIHYMVNLYNEKNLKLI